MVLGGAMLATLALSFAILMALRYIGPAFSFRRSALALSLIVWTATFLNGHMQIRLLLRPITTLSQQSTDLRRDPQHAIAPLPHYGTLELRDLAHGTATTATALPDRKAQTRSFTDQVTHDLKTPVTAIRKELHPKVARAVERSVILKAGLAILWHDYFA